MTINRYRRELFLNILLVPLLLIVNLLSVQAQHIMDGETSCKQKLHTGPITSAAFSNDEKLVLTGSKDSTLRLWDFKNGTCLLCLTGHKSEIINVALSPNKKYALSIGRDSTVRLWDLKNGKEIKQYFTKEQILQIAFLPDNKRFFYSDYSSVHLIDLDNKKELNTLNFTGFKHSIAFSSDSKLMLLSSNDGSIILFDVKTLKEIRRFIGHKHPALSLKFAENRHLVISGGSDRTVCIWEINSGNELYKFEADTFINSVDYSEEVHLIVAGGGKFNKTQEAWIVDAKDTTPIILWNDISKKEIKRFINHKSWVIEVRFSIDKKSIIHANQDGNIYFDDIETGKNIRHFNVGPTNIERP